MKTRRVVVGLLVIFAGAWMALRYVKWDQPTGAAYYLLKANGKKVSLTAAQAQHNPRAVFSWPRTTGLWVAAFCTLAVFSFLYRDNPLYRVAEHAFVGISAAYWMCVAFWAIIVRNLAAGLFPRAVKFSLQPGIDLDAVVDRLAQKSWIAGVVDYQGAHGDGLTAAWWQLMDFSYWLPAILGVMLLWRLAPKGAWIARWPLAFVVGLTAGLRLVAYLESDFVAQIGATIRSLYEPVYEVVAGQAVLSAGGTFYASVVSNLVLVVGTLCGLIYFFFSLEHKGLLGRAARVGVWVLMITFGAGFGFTVMARVALLVQRLEFLVVDWLNLVPP